MTRQDIKRAMFDKEIKQVDIVRHINAQGVIRCNPSEVSLALSGSLKTQKADHILRAAEEYITNYE